MLPLRFCQRHLVRPNWDTGGQWRYLQDVARHYDSILLQPISSGTEYRIFLLDDEVVYAARKYPPFIEGDGVRSIRDLLIAHNAALQARGLSPASAKRDTSLDTVLARGERWDIPGRMNLSAGGTMRIESPSSDAAVAVAQGEATSALVHWRSRFEALA